MQKAFGLVEIIVALGIFGTAIVTTIALTVNSYLAVKNNELADLANSVMVRSMEYFKSPSGIEILKNRQTPTAPKAFFAVATDVSISDVNAGLTFVQKTGAQQITTCDTGSEYKVDLIEVQGIPSDFLMCNQVIAETQTDGSFLLKSIVYYKRGDLLLNSQLIGYRQP